MEGRPLLLVLLFVVFTSAENPVTNAWGDQIWLDENGRLHRDGDEPAVVKANGDRQWWTHGLCTRANGKPAIVRANGYKSFYNDEGRLVSWENDRGERFFYSRPKPVNHFDMCDGILKLR